MYRALVSASVLVGCFLVPGVAAAYTKPSGLAGNYSAVCAPRPSDVGGAQVGTGTDTLVSANGVAGDGGGLTVSSSNNAAGGPAGLAVEGVTAQAYVATVEHEDSTGAWHIVGQWPSVAASGNQAVEESIGYLPPGPSRVLLSVTLSTSSYYVELTGGLTAQPKDEDAATVEQELADACIRTEQLTAITQGDLGTLDTDTKSVGADVNGLTANGTTLDTLKLSLAALDTDVRALTANGATLDTVSGGLSVLHADMGTLESDVLSGSGGTGGSGSGGTQDVALTGPVQLSSADRQMTADTANQLDGDLWVIVGVIIGCFASGFAINRLFPV